MQSRGIKLRAGMSKKTRKKKIQDLLKRQREELNRELLITPEIFLLKLMKRGARH